MTMNGGSEIADVVVIGGGISGLSTAFALAANGAGRVVVLERSTLSSGGTGKSSGVVRCHYGVRSLAAMAWSSLPTLRDAELRLGESAGFHETGYLVGVGENNVAALFANVAMQRSLGIEVEIIGHDKAHELWPAAELGDFAAFAYEPRAGYGDGHQTAMAFAAAARRLGVDVRQQSEVAALEMSGEELGSVRLTDGGRLFAPDVVVAGGVWSKDLLGKVGIHLPVRAQRAPILLVEPGQQLGRVPVLSDLVLLQYVRMDGTSSLLVGDSDHSDPDWADPDDYSDHAYEEELQRSALKFYQRFPTLGDARLSSSYAGCYDVTPDYNPVISATPIQGLWICAGFSGHGYKISPAVGELMANLILHGGSKVPDIDVQDFRLERFEKNELLISPHPYIGAGSMR